MGRTRHGGLLFQSEDYGQVAAMRFSLLAQPKDAGDLQGHPYGNA